MPDAGIGSFFAYPDEATLAGSASDDRSTPWPPDEWLLVNSGRAALITIMEQHLLSHPRGRLWVPSYYCWDVTRYVADRAPVITYPSRPTAAHLPDHLGEDDLLLVTSYFGAEPAIPPVSIEQVVLDTTHDPTAEWLARYEASWVFGSLRKTLPLPEGGYVHSPGHLVQLNRPGLTMDSRSEARRGTSAMNQKFRWINGDTSIGKEEWYQSLQEHEAAFHTLGPASIQPETLALLHALPVSRWRNDRLRNLQHLRHAINADLAGSALPGSYGLPLVLPTPEAAEAVRARLIGQGIYPARIWPQPDDAPAEDQDLAERMLLLHTDFRYSEADMQRVADGVNASLRLTDSSG